MGHPRGGGGKIDVVEFEERMRVDDGRNWMAGTRSVRDCAADSGADGILVCGGVSCGWRGLAWRRWWGVWCWWGRGLWLRGYAAGYVKKNQELTMTGPYGYTRNPLYVGSMMIAFGFAVAGGRWSIGVALAGLVSGDLSACHPSPRRSFCGRSLRGSRPMRRGFRGFCRDGRRGESPRVMHPRPELELEMVGDSGAGGVFAGLVSASPRVQCTYGGRGHLCGAGDPALAATLRFARSRRGSRRGDELRCSSFD